VPRAPGTHVAAAFDLVAKRGHQVNSSLNLHTTACDPSNYGTSCRVMPNSHRPPDTTRRSCLCRVRRCELSLEAVWQSLNSQPIDHPRRVMFSEEVYGSSHHAHSVFTFCPTHSDADPTQNAPIWRSGRLSSYRHTRHDKTVLSVSCLPLRCELDNCY